MDWKRFCAPLHEEMKKEQIWPCIIATLGVSLTMGFYGKEVDSYWMYMGLILLWSVVSYFFYLVYLYNKS